MNKRSGFTIVELLVVIVVISVLASVTVVAYNGVQQRANASAVGAAINAYAKAIRLYKVDNGKYPIPYSGTVARACLGTSAAVYPASGSYTAGSCEFESGSQLSMYYASVMSALTPYMNGNSPSFPMNTFETNYYTTGFTIRGIEYYYNSYYDTVRLRFVVSGPTCPVGGDENAGTVPSTNNTTMCYYDLK